MFHVQGVAKNGCNLLAVFSGKLVDCRERYEVVSGSENCPVYPYPELVSSGRLEVQAVTNPSIVELRQAVEASQPNFVYVQGELVEGSEEVGPLVLGDTEVSSVEAFCDVFGSILPTTVYLEIPDGEKLADALYSKGVRYVIYWKNAVSRNAVSRYAACHFRQALFSVVQSSCSHTWDTFRLAQASFRLYCVSNNYVLPSNSENEGGKLGPCLIGDPPAIDIVLPEAEPEEDEEGSRETLPAIKIYDEDVNTRFLICGEPYKIDACLLGALEDGLNALLSIEMRGCKLNNRTSAPPPPLQAAAFPRNVVTMRCDMSTSTSAHISLLVSGSAQTCFDDELLENHIKHEVIEKNQIVQALPRGEDSRIHYSEPRRSAAIACGASVFEVCIIIPAWAVQVLRQLAPDVSYRSLVALGIASIQGLPVASFEKDDAERLLFFCKKHDEPLRDNSVPTIPPSWFVPPLPSRKRHESCQESKSLISNGQNGDNGSVFRPKLNIAAMRPIPHVRRHKLFSFPTIMDTDRYEVDQSRPYFSAPPAKQSIMGRPPVTQRKSLSSTYQAQQIIGLNPLPLKKHGCGRSPIHSCSEKEFLRDVMQFLMHRGYNRLIPQGGLAEFPDAILNAKRLDLYNLYREVVSRGGFHVGNGINWKGQVFSKMRNHTLTNRMTGVGNTLKRHYETYLLEYELAHDDVDGECCLLCHSAAGDWVNCGICGEWAHFGCDRRQGLGAFKDYAKTDGLEYICPHCSVTSFRKKSQKLTNGNLTF